MKFKAITDSKPQIFNSFKEKKIFHKVAGANRPFTQGSYISKEHLNQLCYPWQQIGQTEVEGVLHCGLS